MSIASELQDLQTNLQAAKSAVTAKGGTVGDTGLAGLASEIASIPSGGGLDNYGTVTYLDNSVEKTVTMNTESDFLELTVGGSGSDITIDGTVIGKSNIISVTIADGVQYLPDRFMNGCTSATSISIPSSVHFFGSYVFLSCTQLNTSLNLANVLYIGDHFMSSCAQYNQPMSLPRVRIIGEYFMENCSSFNSSLVLNNGTEVIGQRFLYSCGNFAQSFSIPAGLSDSSAVSQNPGVGFMHRCNNFVGPLVCNSPAVTKIPTDYNTLSTNTVSAPIYVTGVTLTGPYAQDWRDKLPDRTTSPYRKLIVA